MARRARLQEFLGKRYTESKELRAFVEDSFGSDAANSIGWDDGINDETSDLIRWLEARGKLAELWPALKAAFPNFVDEIATLAAEWKPTFGIIPLGFFHKRVVQIAIAAVLAASIAIVTVLWMRARSHTAIIVLDADARLLVTTQGTPFAVEVDGKPIPISIRGVSIGKSESLPDELAALYREKLGDSASSPAFVEIPLTNKRASRMRITFNAEPCKGQPAFVARDEVYVVARAACTGSAGVARTPASAKIGVVVTLEDHGELRANFSKDLRGQPTPITIEEFLADRVIEQLGRLAMFQLVRASAEIPPASTLVVRIDTSWPRGPVELRMKLGDEPVHTLTLFRGLGCGTEPCFPDDLSLPLTYEAVFTSLFSSWPKGFLGSIALTTTALYGAGGIIRTEEDLGKFGQPPAGPPQALFQITYGNEPTQRTFVFCQTRDKEPLKGFGRDAPHNDATCWAGPPPVGTPAGIDGTVTLVNVLPSTVPSP